MKVIPFTRHALQADLDAYVTDTLGPEQTERLESHVFRCAECAQRLTEAARFETLLHDVATSATVSQPVAPTVARPWHRRLAAAGGAWAAAAAVAMMMWGPQQVESSDSTLAASAVRVDRSEWISDPWASGCTPGDPGCAGDLLASIDPLESIDPLSSWPDDPQVHVGWNEIEFVDGEPCGSGEDGGPLVCPRPALPVSG